MKKKKAILVIDWLDAYGGSEKVAKYLHQIYDFKKVYTLVNVMSEDNLKKIFPNQEIEIRTSFLQILGNHFRYGLPLFPLALKRLKIKDKNAIVISISHSVVKGISVPKSSTHVSYLVARNLKYVWEEKELYFVGLKKVFSFIIPLLRRFDVKMAKKPAKILSVSNFVSTWAEGKYQRDITTINPPVQTKEFNFQEHKENFYVSVGRLEPYKRFDILIEAFNKNGKKLIIIGDGSLMPVLKRKAKKNIEFTGYLHPEKSKEFLKRAKAFVFCGKEDFGIALLEPQVCGTPVITFKEGGALDSVKEKITGVFFDEQTPKSLNSALDKFETQDYDPHLIRKHAMSFSVEEFKKNFENIVSNEIQKKV